MILKVVNGTSKQKTAYRPQLVRQTDRLIERQTVSLFILNVLVS